MYTKTHPIYSWFVIDVKFKLEIMFVIDENKMKFLVRQNMSICMKPKRSRLRFFLKKNNQELNSTVTQKWTNPISI